MCIPLSQNEERTGKVPIQIYYLNCFYFVNKWNNADFLLTSFHYPTPFIISFSQYSHHTSIKYITLHNLSFWSNITEQLFN